MTIPNGVLSFCTDSMLGKLGRWLRIAGFDTTYASVVARQQVIDEALASGRIIISRQNAPKDFPGLKANEFLNLQTMRSSETSTSRKAPLASWLLIPSNHWREQLAAVMKWLKMDLQDLPLTSRCSRCNRNLINTPKPLVHCLVPAHTYETHHQFKKCPSCQKIFWPGTHASRIKEELESIFLSYLFHCDHCGKQVPPGSVKFRGQLDLSSLYERLDLKEKDLSTDHWPEINRLIGEISMMSQEELTESVYAKLSFTLCASCKSLFLQQVKSFLNGTKGKVSQ